jgi:hypothetical protein
MDPESGMEKFGFGIRDKHLGSATLHTRNYVRYRYAGLRSQTAWICIIFGSGIRIRNRMKIWILLRI